MAKLLERMVKHKIKKDRAKRILGYLDRPKWVGRGRHSVVIKSKGVAVKVEKDVRAAKGCAKKEAYFLRRLNKFDIGPKFRSYSNKSRYVRYDFAEGEFLVDFLKKADDRKAKKMIRKCFEKAFKMDLLKINKEEMHKPLKHIIVNKNNVIFIDFERCHYTSNPKNVSQLVSFFFKNENVAQLIRKYKKKTNRENFEKIMEFLKIP